MWTNYRLLPKSSDPVATFHLPVEILNDLKSRAKVLGRSVETEFKLRLIRSLEADKARDLSDQLLEAIYYSEEEGV